MNDISSRVVYLIERHLNDELTGSEQQELEEWKGQSESNREFFEKLTDKDYLIRTLGDSYKGETRQRVRRKIQQLIEKDAEDDKGEEAKVVFYRRFTWRKLVPAAAAVVIIVGAVGYFISQSNKPRPATQTAQKTIINDKAPGRDGAILRLSNGQEIVLDNAANGNLAKQGSASITKEGNQLAYSSAGKSSTEVLYNTLRTPVGRQFQLVLPDGTKAVLNSSSSITYPTSFTGNKRDVTMSGEIYFEVAKDAARPFRAHVTSPMTGMEETVVQVLGTHFNINAYGDEMPVKTTLLEGKVKVSEGKSEATLKPGEQAQVELNNISVKQDVDIDKETAWKNGLFSFKNDKLKGIMPQIARWYDVDIVYQGKNVQNVGITGEIERSANLSEVLKLFSFININYSLEGRKLILKDQQ